MAIDKALKETFKRIENRTLEDHAENDRKIKEKQEAEKIGERYSCRKCGSVIKINIGAEIHKCCCGAEDWEFLGKEYYTESQYKKAVEQFKNKNLLNHIWDELSKTHIGDNNLKLTTFLTCVSSLLKNMKQRMSIAITGNSSEGKDNNIKTSLRHLPIDIFIFLTSGTQATIEDDIKDKRIIAFSEINVNRDNGANKFLVEIIKQKTDGGTSSVKKDIRTGMRSARHEKGDQCSVLYGTTEAGMDEEMQTRFIKATIETDPIRIKKVNDNTLDTFSDLDKLFGDSEKEDSWIRIGLSYFFNHKEAPEIYAPYAKYLKEKVKGSFLFDHNNPRSQRDIKRVLALTCAMTYLFQEQRKIIEHKGKKVLVSEPRDLINTLLITEQFFNQSYSGLDKRLTNVLDIIDKLGTEWVARDDIQKEMDVKRKVTIKSYCQNLAEEGLIEGCSGRELNDIKGLKIYHGNKIYYKRVQKGVKKRLIRVPINDLKTFLEEKTKKTIAPFSLTHNSDDKKNEKGCKNKGCIWGQKVAKVEKSEDLNKNRPFEIAPLNINKFTDEEIKQTGYKPDELKEISEDSNDE